MLLLESLATDRYCHSVATLLITFREVLVNSRVILGKLFDNNSRN